MRLGHEIRIGGAEGGDLLRCSSVETATRAAWL